MSNPIYALNLFNVSNKDEYLAYSRRSAEEVQAHGGRVIALGKFRKATAGDISPRNVLILVEWMSMEAFDKMIRPLPICTNTASTGQIAISGIFSTSWRILDPSSRERGEGRSRD